MDRVTYKLTMDLANPAAVNRVYTNQTNFGALRIVVALRNGSEAYTVPEGYLVTAYSFFENEATSVCDCRCEDGLIVFEPPYAAQSGKAELAFKITNGESFLLETPTFHLISLATLYDDGKVIASDEFPLLQTKLGEVQSATSAAKIAANAADAATEKAKEAAKEAEDAVNAAEKALQIANAASEAALAKDTAGSVIELNQNRSVFLWYGTKAEYEAQKDTLPENTDCTIIDDDTILLLQEAIAGKAPSGLVAGTIWVNTDSEDEKDLDPQLKVIYDAMADGTMRNLLVIDLSGSSAFAGGNVFLTICKTSDAYGAITAIKYWGLGTPVEWRREISDGIWHDWGWVNPPMGVWVEYRTTEMWEANPVYTQVVHCTALPNGGTMNIAHEISNIRSVLRCSGFLSDGQALPIWNSTTDYLTVNANKTHINFYSPANYSGGTAYVQIWYTKEEV